MSKSRFTAEEKEGIVREYIEGKGSYCAIAEKHGIKHATLQMWVRQYQEDGIEGLVTRTRNASYTKEFKQKCVEEVISGEGTTYDVTAKYHISSRSVLIRWIKVYNANMELKDYEPKREVYMAEARRKTTKEERIEIVKYCIEHNCDYKNTAAKYDVSYSQVYAWVRSYKANGEEGLEDRRGRRKPDEEVDELERLRRENLRLKKQLKEQEMLNELLKKVKELERG